MKIHCIGLEPDDSIPDGWSFDIANRKYRRFKTGNHLLEYTIEGDGITIDWVSGKNMVILMKPILDNEEAEVHRISGYLTDKLSRASDVAIERLVRRAKLTIGSGWRFRLSRIEGRRYVTLEKER